MDDVAPQVFTMDVDLPAEYPPGQQMHVVDVPHALDTTHVEWAVYDAAGNRLWDVSGILTDANTASLGIRRSGPLKIVVIG